MSKIPDLTPEEIKVVKDALQERYGHPVEPEQVDVELRLSPDDSQVTECPALYWEQKGCNFLIAKTGKERYYCQFFYSGREQYGTGRQDYDDMLDCVLTLLRVQADHELDRNLKKENLK